MRKRVVGPIIPERSQRGTICQIIRRFERPKKMYRFGVQVDFGGLKAASVEATVNMIGEGLP